MTSSSTYLARYIVLTNLLYSTQVCACLVYFWTCILIVSLYFRPLGHEIRPVNICYDFVIFLILRSPLKCYYIDSSRYACYLSF